MLSEPTAQLMSGLKAHRYRAVRAARCAWGKAIQIRPQSLASEAWFAWTITWTDPAGDFLDDVHNCLRRNMSRSGWIAA